MQTAYSFLMEPRIYAQVPAKQKIKVRPRDMEILKFLLEMKFSSLEEIHVKFFRDTRFGLKSTSLRWVRERVAALIEAGFVRAVAGIFKKTLYVATQRSYLYLKNSFGVDKCCRPIQEIDKHTLNHDLTLVQVRLELEEKSSGLSWISEKYMMDHSQVFAGFTSEFRPDAIYSIKGNSQIALELELARKSKKRYQEKIKRYSNLLMSSSSNPTFEKIHFICSDLRVLEILKEETQLFEPYFKFSLLSEILSTGEVANA